MSNTFFVIPLSAFLIILRAQVVRIVLGSGRFDWEDTILTLTVLGILSLSLFAQSLNLLFVRAYFALQDTTTPLKSGILGLICNITIGAVSVKYWHLIASFTENKINIAGFSSPITGLALAYTISQIAIFIFLFIGLRDPLKGIEVRSIKKSLKKIALATFLSGLVVQIAKWSWGVFIPLTTFLSVLGQIALAGTLGIAFYLFICKILKCKELKNLYHECPQILRFKKTNSDRS